MQNIAYICLLGVLGILSRYGIDQFFSNLNEQFPVTTLAINIVGSFLAGVLYVLSVNRNFSETLQLCLLVGFCGGFTTFSSYTLQTMTMIDRGRIAPAMIYLVLSPALGLLAAFIPIFCFRRMIT